MKRLLLTLLLSPVALAAQIVYSEDFESVPITSGYFAQLPAAFTLYTDGNTSGFTLPYNDPWLVAQGFPEKAAVCPTYFTPSGQADRWLITPAITLTNGNNLIWRSKTYWNQIPELYEVKLSTTGTQQSDFTTTLATIGNDSDVYRMHSLSLAAWSGQTVYVAFRMRSNYGWYFYLDEIRVEDGTANDAAVIGSDFHSFEPQAGAPVHFHVFNNSVNPITSLQLNYSVDGGLPQTQTLSLLNIAGFDTVNLIHSIPWTGMTTGGHTVRLWTSNVNAGTDLRPANDTFTVNVGIVSQVAVKNVMVEEHTGAWCGYCVDGSYHLELLANAYPWVIPYAIHSSDAMSFPGGDSINVNVPAYPSGFFDRHNYPDDDGFWGCSDRTVWEDYTLDRHTDGTPCAVAITHTYNASTRLLTATVNATFYGNFTDNYRLNLYLVEDSVSGGTGSQWDQTNYYSSQSTGYGGPSHPYYNLPSPIVGYRHRHVCRAMPGGPWGVAGSVPASVTDGGQYSHTFTYTVPANFDASRITLVGMVQRYDPNYQERPIYNSVAIPMIAPNGIAVNDAVSSLDVFPNPSNDGNFTLKLQLSEAVSVSWEITDVTGKVVAVAEMRSFAAGEQLLPVSTEALPAGVYLLNVRAGEALHTLRIVSTK